MPRKRDIKKLDQLDQVSFVRILLVSGIYPPDIGGPATFMPQLRTALLERGHAPIVLTLGNKLELNPENRIYKIPRNLPIPIRFGVLVFFIFVLGLRSEFIYVNGLHEEAGLANSLLRKKSIAKVVGDPIWEKARNKRATNLEILEFNKSKKTSSERLRLKLLVFSLRQFSEIHCPSTELVQILSSWSVKLAPEYRPNGVMITELEDEKSQAKEFDLITVSRLVPWKNIEKILAGIKGTNLSLAIIGTGPDEKSLRKLALSLENRVSFLGSKNQSEITSLMVKSRIFVQLSSYEGQSFSLLQAMSLGLPVVISDIPGNTEVVSNCQDGIILKDLQEETIKSTLVELSENEELHRRIGASGRLRVVNNFNLKSQFDTLISQIEHSRK